MPGAAARDGPGRSAAGVFALARPALAESAGRLFNRFLDLSLASS